jgi:hypothetical protein
MGIGRLEMGDGRPGCNAQEFQRRHRDKGDIQSVAEPFGCTGTYSQAGIAPRPFGKGYSLYREVLLPREREQFLYIAR